ATGDDLGGPNADDKCAAGCYDCLLSYSNQFDHALIDRRLVRDTLLALASSTTAAGSAGRAPDNALRYLDAFTDSSLERRFLDHLQAGGYRLPDRAQVTVTDATARPDFVYNSAYAAVFVDGPHHDADHQADRDAHAQERLEDAGWHVIR